MSTPTPIYKKTTPEVKDDNGVVVTPSVDSYFNDNECTLENNEYANLEDKTGFAENACPSTTGGRRRSKKSKKSKKAKKTKKSKKSKKTKKSRKH